MTPSAADWRALAGVIAGQVILPGSPGYDEARRPAVARFWDARPQAVVRCQGPEDVAEVITLARRSGTATAVRSGGHCFAGRSSTDGIVIDVSPISAVSVATGRAIVGAGTRLGKLGDALAGHGVAIPTGCGDEVGIAGLTLGGGLGILGRSHGLTCDNLLGAQVVLADGRVVECGGTHEPELFWALRGAGGGTIGVVTSLTFRTIPAPPATTFRLDWPCSHAARAIAAWQAWAPGGPDELAASLLLTAPADPGRAVTVTVFGAVLGSEAGAEPLLAELAWRVGADPAAAWLEQLPFREAKRRLATTHPGEDRPAAHVFSKSEFFARPLPERMIAELAEVLERDRVAGESRELDFTPWGGAYGRVRADATAFAHRHAQFLLKHSAAIDPTVAAAPVQDARGWPARSWASVHAFGTGGVYPNFPDPDLPDPARAYYGDNHARLRRVKARYDPDNFFLAVSPSGRGRSTAMT
jgi:FAD/FMN-containing dehydrogenase